MLIRERGSATGQIFCIHGQECGQTKHNVCVCLLPQLSHWLVDGIVYEDFISGLPGKCACNLVAPSYWGWQHQQQVGCQATSTTFAGKGRVGSFCGRPVVMIKPCKHSRLGV